MRHGCTGADTTRTRYYLNLPGADHFAPVPRAMVRRSPSWRGSPSTFLDYYLLGERDRLGAMWRASKVPGVAGDGRGGPAAAKTANQGRAPAAGYDPVFTCP